MLQVYSAHSLASYPNANGPLGLLPLIPIVTLANHLGWANDIRLRAGLTNAVFAIFAMLLTVTALRVIERARGALEWRLAASCVFLVAPALLCRVAIPVMRESGHGSIVNVTSRVVQRANRRRAAYTASKGGLDALTRAISVDIAGDGIRCNAVQCGYILHERRDARLSPERRAELEAMQLTRLATPVDVAHAVVFLASRESEVITGVTLQVDGGSTSVRARTVG